MYSRISNKSYRDVPVTDTQLTCCANYVYSSVEDLTKHKERESLLGELAWCRTVGILDSFHGHLFVYDINATGGLASDVKIQISLAHLNSSKSTGMHQSLVMPCPVQIFGSIQWHCKRPIVFIKLIQVITVPKAIQIKDVMDHLIEFKIVK